MGAHMAHGVVMDVTAFKVCHSVVLDIDATALQAAIEMCSSTKRTRLGGRQGKTASIPLPLHCHEYCWLRS